jgi:hypothetical protein
MQNIHQQKKTAGNTDGQSRDVDEAVSLILQDRAEGYFEKIFKHKASGILYQDGVIVKKV